MVFNTCYSGPCMTLVVSKPGDTVGHGFIPEFRNFVGPTDVNTAKEEAPERYVGAAIFHC